jgi:hypothetical protein
MKTGRYLSVDFLLSTLSSPYDFRISGEPTMSNPYEAPKYEPRDRPAREQSVAVRAKPWHPLWGVFSAVVFDFVTSFLVGTAFGFVVAVILTLWENAA